MSSGKEPAFPNPGTYGCTASGMTLRDYFAGQALMAIISKAELEKVPLDDGSDVERCVARGAYSYADAMLAVREFGV